MAQKRVTSLDVAALAGVSQSAVSRAFTSGASIAEETRNKVLAVAEQLGYQPNALARGLTSHRTNIIGILMADVNNPFYTMVLDQFARQLQDIDRHVLFFNVPRDKDIDSKLSRVLQYQVDGVVITSATLSSAMADECARLGIPVVLFNRYILGAKVSAVCCDAVAGGRLVADAFLDAGSQRIGYMAGRENTSTNLDRERGFVGRLQERGAGVDLRDCGEFDYEAGYAAARRMLERNDRPDAIFCASDLMAMATIDVARQVLGLKVPDDISIIGFDDIPMAQWNTYQLTTVRQPVKHMVRAAIEVLMQNIEGGEADRVFRWIAGTLVRRGSARLAPEVR